MLLKQHSTRFSFRNILAFLPLLVIGGCSSISGVSTNIDKKNFDEYFAPSKVTIYESVNDLGTSYRLMGAVEGNNCQIKPHHAKPDPIEARTEARKAALAINANAIVFSNCITLEKRQTPKHCHAALVCYGQAYQVVDKTSQ